MSDAGNTALAAYSLARRELVRFLRQRNRVFGALATPLIFWGLFGSGLSPSFSAVGGTAGMDYAEYFFPGTVILILLFTAIFATISIIDDRREGFLQSVLVSPVSSTGIVLGKLIGTTTLAVGQAALVMLFAPLAGIPLSLASLASAFAVLCLVAFGLAGLGFLIAWRMDSTQGFHAVMNAFLMPMWFLSGAMFPSVGVPGWLGWIMAINPLTYGLAAFRHILYADRPEALGQLPDFSLCMAVVIAFATFTFALAVRWAGSYDADEGS